MTIHFHTFLNCGCRLMLIAVFYVADLTSAIADGSNSIDMIDFTQPDQHLIWQSTNDGVMGGISQGHLSFDGELSVFSGKLSLANNGGFSSVASKLNPLDPSIVAIELDYIGDGREYQLRFATKASGETVRYKHEFSTEKGQLQTYRLLLKDFQAVFRGRLLHNAPELEAQHIEQIGFLIADKQAGPFELKLIQVRFMTEKYH